MVWGKPQGIDDIVERLRRNDPSMKSLYLMKHRRFNEADAEILSKVVSESSTLVELNLSSHDISPAMARILASGLQKNKSIEHISIGNSKFGDEALAELCVCLKENRTIHTIDLESKGITGKSGTILSDSIRVSAVRHLVLSNNDLGHAFLKQLHPCIGDLESLMMTNCNLELKHSNDISNTDGFISGVNMKRLDLDSNNIGKNQSEILSRSLALCPSLEILSLSNNPLEDIGIDRVVKSAPESLAQLHVGSTRANSKGVSSIANKISCGQLPRLECLNICDNQLSFLDLTGLMRAIKTANLELRCNKPINIDCADNPLNDTENANDFFGSVLECSNIKSLVMRGCNLGGSIINDLLRVAQSGEAKVPHHSLNELDLSGNQIDENSMVYILQNMETILGAFPKLKFLIVAANPGVESKVVSDTVESLPPSASHVCIVRAASDSQANSDPSRN